MYTLPPLVYTGSRNCDEVNPLSTNSIKWSNTLKKFVSNLPTNCFSVFDHSVGLALKKLKLTPRMLLDKRWHYSRH